MTPPRRPARTAPSSSNCVSTTSNATWERVRGLVPQIVPEIVLEPTDMQWGNRSMILRDPDGGLVNLFTPVTPEAKAKFVLT